MIARFEHAKTTCAYFFARSTRKVIVLSGATGSGKTTQVSCLVRRSCSQISYDYGDDDDQVPQLVLDDLVERGDGAMCNIICTQVRSAYHWFSLWNPLHLIENVT